MKKFTLSLATLFVAVAAIASPTAEEVSALTLRIDKVDGATIRVKNSDDLNAVLIAVIRQSESTGNTPGSFAILISAFIMSVLSCISGITDAITAKLL